MSTKLTELRDGCFAKAMDDEPMFVLLARDPQAPLLVRNWAARRRLDIGMGRRPAADMVQVDDAERTAAAMETWRIENDGAWRTGLFADQAHEPRIVDMCEGDEITVISSGGRFATTIPVIARDDHRLAGEMLADIRCKAVQYHDLKVCRTCNLSWPVDDARPEGCQAASVSHNVNAVVIPSMAAIERARAAMSGRTVEIIDPKPATVAFDFTDVQQAPSHSVERQGDEYFCTCGMRWGTDESDPHQ